MDHDRAQVPAALFFYQPRAVFRRDMIDPVFMQAVLDALPDGARRARHSERRQARFRVFGRLRLDRADAGSDGLRDLLRVARGPNPGAIDAPTTAVQEDAVNHHIEVFLPLVNHVVAQQYLAEPGAVNLNARVAPVAFDRGRAAEDHRAIRSPHDLGAHVAAAWIDRNRFFRNARFD